MCTDLNYNIAQTSCENTRNTRVSEHFPTRYEGVAFREALPSDLLNFFVYSQERLPCSWVVTLPPLILLHTFLWGHLDSFNCTAIVPFTDQGCWELEECGLERLGNWEGQRWDNRWRSESPLEDSPHCPVCLVTYLAHAWKSFLAESYIGRSKIQESLALKYCWGRGRRGWLTDYMWSESEFTYFLGSEMHDMVVNIFLR